MRFETLRGAVESALHAFKKQDIHLISVNSSERSITYAISRYLASQDDLKSWTIDCEYSRNGGEILLLTFPAKDDAKFELEWHQRGHAQSLEQYSWPKS